MATNLIDYGIQHDEAAIRVHVCPLARMVYAFRTSAALEAIRRQHDIRPAYQIVNGQRELTAAGHVVSWDSIPGVIAVPLSPLLWNLHPFRIDMSETEKGKQAELIVKAALTLGHIPLPLTAALETRHNQQLRGIDLRIPETTIQVKCDYRGGHRPHGTGNLFLQIAERNPNRLT